MHRVLVVACLLLGGCAQYLDMSSDAFAHGKTSEEAFYRDSSVCQQQAEARRSYSAAAIDTGEARRHHIYNKAYAGCMAALEYQRRTQWFNFWEGYVW